MNIRNTNQLSWAINYLLLNIITIIINTITIIPLISITRLLFLILLILIGNWFDQLVRN